MCKCSTSVCPGGKCKQEIALFATNEPSGQVESVIGAKKKIRVQTPQQIVEFEAGRMYRLPKNQARDLIEKAKAPIWIIA